MLFKSLISSVSKVSTNKSSSLVVSNNKSLSLFDENSITNRNINITTYFTRPNYITM